MFLNKKYEKMSNIDAFVKFETPYNFPTLPFEPWKKLENI